MSDLKKLEDEAKLFEAIQDNVHKIVEIFHLSENWRMKSVCAGSCSKSI